MDPEPPPPTDEADERPVGEVLQGVIQRERRLQQELEEVEAELSWAGRDREVQERLRDLICRLRMAHKSFRASLEVVQMEAGAVSLAADAASRLRSAHAETQAPVPLAGGPTD